MVLLNASLEEILGDKPSLLEAVLHGLVINKNPYKSLLGKKVRRAQIEAAFPPFPVNQPFHSSDVLLSSNEQIVQPSAELSLVYHRTQIILIFISLIFLSLDVQIQKTWQSNLLSWDQPTFLVQSNLFNPGCLFNQADTFFFLNH